MKFITEETLRTQYRQSPFESYLVEKDTRLTPGAYQFLVDRRVVVHYEDEKFQRMQGKKQIQTTDVSSLQRPTDTVAPVSVALEWAQAHLFMTRSMTAAMCNRTLSQSLVTIGDRLTALQGAIKTQSPIGLDLLAGGAEGSGADAFAIQQFPVNTPCAMAQGQLNMLRVACLDVAQKLKGLSGEDSVRQGYIQVITTCVHEVETVIRALAEVHDGLQNN